MIIRTPRLALSVSAVLLLAAGCAKKASDVPMTPAVPVTIAKAVQKPVPLAVHAIGTGEAYSTVSIKAQVSAELMEVHFREGQDVQRGDLLFTLDRRPFEASLRQAQANLARDKAQAENAAVQARRYARLYQEGVASKEQRDQFTANAEATEAAVRADDAAVEYAKLQLQFCSIYSPIHGRTGSLMVHPGNLVKANDVPVLVVINQITPIYVVFSLPEQYLAEVKKYMAAGKLAVEAYLPNSPRQPETGYLSFVDNAVDDTTGTVKFKGTFPNADKRLWPGQFVNVVLKLAEQQNAVVVPSQAVQTGQNGSFVFVVKPDLTAESRPVEVTRSTDGETVIAKGIRTGEMVVTDGQVQLVPGAKVELRNGLTGN